METGSLDALTQACRLLADGTRLRLLAVLETDALSVAELTQVTGLAQSRVSSHVSKLREAQLLTDSRLGASTLYSFSPDVGDSLPGEIIDAAPFDKCSPFFRTCQTCIFSEWLLPGLLQFLRFLGEPGLRRRGGGDTELGRR